MRRLKTYFTFTLKCAQASFFCNYQTWELTFGWTGEAWSKPMRKWLSQSMTRMARASLPTSGLKLLWPPWAAGNGSAGKCVLPWTAQLVAPKEASTRVTRIKSSLSSGKGIRSPKCARSTGGRPKGNEGRHPRQGEKSDLFSDPTSPFKQPTACKLCEWSIVKRLPNRQSLDS